MASVSVLTGGGRVTMVTIERRARRALRVDPLTALKAE
jgi:hypothetical protein